MITPWPLCASFHSDMNVEVSLPYASYGLLYAASVMTGLSGGLHGPAEASVAELEPHADARLATSKRADADMRTRMRESAIWISPFRSTNRPGDLRLGLRRSGQPKEDSCVGEATKHHPQRETPFSGGPVDRRARGMNT